MPVRSTLTGMCGLSAVLALSAGSACATTIQDLVWIKGQEPAVVQGMGIVVGLNGTGDTSKGSLVAARPYAQLLANYANPVLDVTELARANAFAIVSVSMTIPGTGGLDGDKFDVTVDKLFNAKSLAGGRLVVSLLRFPGPDSPRNLPVAFAEGQLVIHPNNPASATIPAGGQLITNLEHRDPVQNGVMTLVLKNQYAGYPVAATIAAAIEDEFSIDGFSDLTTVRDAKHLHVHVPQPERAEPAQFIAALMTIPIDATLIQTEARIVVNRRVGSISVTGDVEIGPVAINHRGMQLTNIAPAAGPAPKRWVGVDTTDGRGRRATRLTDLMAAFEQLSVSTADQIDIIIDLERTGVLHAEIIHQ